MRFQTPTVDVLAAMRGWPVFGSDGEKIGEVEDIFYDSATGEPEWIGVGAGVMGGLLGSRHYVAPVQGAQFGERATDGIRVPYPKDQVSSAPSIEGEEISEEAEMEIYRHYGIQPSQRRSETQLPEQHGRTDVTDRPEAGFREGFREGYSASTPPRTEVGNEASVTRREEELRVGKRQAERGQVRLRKWVEVAPVSEDVELRRETAHVERETVNRPAPGAQIGEEEVSVTLHEEQAVTSKDTVERERVTLDVDEEAHRETVRDEVRREHVDVEGDVDETEEALHRRRADEEARSRRQGGR